MTLSKAVAEDKIEIVGNGILQVRTVTTVSEDGVEISRQNSRHVVEPYVFNTETNKFVENDISGQSAKVKAVATAVWDADTKAAFLAAVTTVPKDDSK
tara:strand:+ start:460 stop:753 length:294 start_codon:yes stop_codon:yes gene_type:complete